VQIAPDSAAIVGAFDVATLTAWERSQVLADRGFLLGRKVMLKAGSAELETLRGLLRSEGLEKIGGAL